MYEILERTEMVLGEKALKKLQSSKVIIFGLGGVGGYVVEALVRGGIGHLAIVDADSVALSNCNRQIIATKDTIGRKKTEVMKERIKQINPECEVEVFDCFYLPEEAGLFEFEKYDYIVDAIDTVTAKIDLAVQAEKLQIPMISSMGTGNKLDPTQFKVADIYKTSVCPLAKVMRKELRARGVKKLKVVYSEEESIATGGRTPGSVSFVPGVAGLIMAGEVMKDIIKDSIEDNIDKKRTHMTV